MAAVAYTGQRGRLQCQSLVLHAKPVAWKLGATHTCQPNIATLQIRGNAIGLYIHTFYENCLYSVRANDDSIGFINIRYEKASYWHLSSRRRLREQSFLYSLFVKEQSFLRVYVVSFVLDYTFVVCIQMLYVQVKMLWVQVYGAKTTLIFPSRNG